MQLLAIDGEVIAKRKAKQRCIKLLETVVGNLHENMYPHAHVELVEAQQV